MKLSVTQKELAKALNIVSHSVSSKPSLPILSNVLLKLEKDKLKLVATDLEISMSTEIKVESSNTGEITVSARTLSEFVNSLSEGTVEIVLEDRTLLVTSEQSNSKFNVIPAEEFPQIPEAEGKPVFKINAKEFAHAIRQVVFATAIDDSRPVLTGVLFEPSKKKVSMIGVDGFRLSKKEVKLEVDTTVSESYIVPARALQELESVLSGEEDEGIVEISLAKGKNQIVFVYDGVEVTSRLIEGQFPDYKQILPSEHTFSFVVDKEALENVVKIVNIFARDIVGNKTLFKIDSKKKTLELAAEVAEVGQNQSTVELSSVEGDSLETAVSSKYLADMLNSIDKEEIVFETTGVTAPAVFKGKDDKSFVHIVMPMRTE